ncbi:hypothetical protein Q8F55_008628 [Vanrija albida]|uniref:alpha-L-fucosidase n=1 Tax=Vanrija albida TaxID=181172 RepID=A0ABR3PRC4_9TREE
MKTALLALALALAAAVGAEQAAFSAPLGPSVPVDLGPYLNNKGTSRSGLKEGVGIRNGSSFPSSFLPVGEWRDAGVLFTFPDWDAVEHDNIRVDAQEVAVGPVEISAVHLIGTGEDPGGFLFQETKDVLGLRFEDGSTGEVSFEVKNFWIHHWNNKSPLAAPYHFLNDSTRNYNATNLYHIPIGLPPSAAGKRVSALILPPKRDANTLRVFALSYIPVVEGARLEDRVRAASVKATRRWGHVHGKKAQVVEVRLANPLSAARRGDPAAWVDAPIDVRLAGDGFVTVGPGRVARLMPGDAVTVEVLIRPTGAASAFDGAEVRLNASGREWSVPVRVEGSGIVHDFAEWTEETADIEQHSSPSWFNGAKFGIFIHWGLYSVPAWADGGKYAEWYDFWLHDEDGNGTTHKHHREVWGEEFVYDDFIPLFTAARFNASAWVELFADAGAKYFVFTTKHHDGYALFDTGATSDRNSLLLGPKRDFLRELMDAAKEEQPHLKRGTYFSMPEWYNPLYAPHGRVSFPGGLAHNPYTGEQEAYTGFVDTGDFIEGIQVPQMRILAQEYATDLIWCDIGLANHSSSFVAEWYAQSAREDRPVAIDNRCGIAGDFVTPEMTKFDTVQPDKWESCASVDPHSFGYNRATRDDEYRNATDIVHYLIDITAKGGNFLLNVGPDAEGVIVDAIQRPLREAGAWLKLNGRAIYDTYPFPLAPEHEDDDAHVFVTRNDGALYLISVRDLGERLAVPVPLPLLPCDKAVLVTPGGDVPVAWGYEGDVLTVDLSGIEEAHRTGAIAYVVEWTYGDCAARVHDEL